MRAVLFLLLFTSVIQKSYAQDCLEKIHQANKLLDMGRARECIDMVYPCTQEADISAQWQAYRLLSISYLLVAKEDSARIFGEKMLELNPTYTVNPLKDPGSFASLLNNIVIIPKFTVGLAISVGTNSTLPNVLQPYAVSDYKKDYKTRSSTQLGTNIGFSLTPNVKIETGLMATTKSYSMDYSFDTWKLEYAEKLTYLEIPLTAKYILPSKKRWRVFGSAGMFGGRLLYAKSDHSAINPTAEEVYTINKLSSMERRKKYNVGVCGGLGLYYKLKSGQLSLESNYYHQLNSIARDEARYDYMDLIYTYFYVDDDLALNNFTFNLGYSFFLNYKVYHGK